MTTFGDQPAPEAGGPREAKRGLAGRMRVFPTGEGDRAVDRETRRPVAPETAPEAGGEDGR